MFIGSEGALGIITQAWLRIQVWDAANAQRMPCPFLTLAHTLTRDHSNGPSTALVRRARFLTS